MKAELFMISVLLGIAIVGLVVADVVNSPNPSNTNLTAEDLGTQYNYKFFVSENGTCDSHYLKSNVNYYIDQWPNQVSIFYPEIIIGFFKPINKSQEIILVDKMTNNDQEMCNYPDGITHEFRILIHPDKFNEVLNVRGIRPRYAADGETGNVTLLIEAISLTPTQENDIKEDLCNMWTLVKK